MIATVFFTHLILSAPALQEKPPELRALVEDLSSEVESVRRVAADQLRELGPNAEPIIPALIALLDEEAVWTYRGSRRAYFTPGSLAAGVLTRLGKPAIGPLIEVLDSPNRLRRGNAVMILGEIGGEDVLAPLIDVSTDQDPEVRGLASEGLGRTRHPQAIDALLARLNDAETSVRVTTVGAIGHFFSERENGQPEVDRFQLMKLVNALIETSRDADERVRQQTVWLLPMTRVSNVVPALVARLDDDNETVAVLAAEGLGELGDPQAVMPLIQSLDRQSRNQYIRLQAAQALGQLGDLRAVRPLISLLQNEEAYVRRDVATALGQLGDRRAVEPLIARLQDSDHQVVDAAALALGDLGDPQAVPSLIEAFNGRVERQPPYARFRALALALGKLNDPRAIEALAQALFSDPDQGVTDHEELVEALAAIRHPAAIVAMADGAVAVGTPHPASFLVRRKMEELTGQGFRFDHAGFCRWWEEHRTEYEVEP